MSQGWPSFSSMKFSKATPTSPAGMVLMSSSQASFSSRVSIFRRRMLPKKALSSRHTSARMSTSMAMNVPTCSATSKVFSRSSDMVRCHPNSQGTRIRWAELEMGKNSVIPWTSPRMIAWTRYGHRPALLPSLSRSTRGSTPPCS